MRTLAVIFLMVAIPGFAQNSAHYRACSQRARTQLQMNACGSEEAARADNRLNDLYNKLLTQAAGEKDAVEKIKAAENAWIGYRDAFIEAMYPAGDKTGEYGSIYPLQASLLRARLTRRQITALQELLQQYAGGAQAGTAKP